MWGISRWPGAAAHCTGTARCRNQGLLARRSPPPASASGETGERSRNEGGQAIAAQHGGQQLDPLRRAIQQTAVGLGRQQEMRELGVEALLRGPVVPQQLIEVVAQIADQRRGGGNTCSAGS